MTKVAEMIGDAAQPRGTLGFAVDHDTAMQLVRDIRSIMTADREESQVAAAAYLYNGQCDHDELIAAWELLNPGERRAWREFCRLGRC